MITDVFNLYYRTKKYASAHKFVSAIAIVLIAGVGWWAYSSATDAGAQTRYVLGIVEKGSIVASVSASGQVSASDQVDIKPKVSGDIVWLGMKPGMNVATGQALATIDDTDARQTVTNAELDLKDAQLTLQKNTSQAPIDFQNSKDAIIKAEQDLVNTYENMYSTVSDAHITLPGVMTEADSLLHGFNISNNSDNSSSYQNLFVSSDESIQRTVRMLANRAEDDYTAARTAYTKTYTDFKTLSRSSSPTQIGQALTDTQQTTKLVSQALSSEVNLIDSVVDIQGQLGRTVSPSITAQQASAHIQLNRRLKQRNRHSRLLP
jgi:multidrug efflux pump subunit AcrA (membrane-fusion protein)